MDFIVNIEVGPEDNIHIFQVHQSLLRKSSPYINETLAENLVTLGEGTQGEGDCICFGKVHYKCFKHFVCWLYTDRIVESGKAEYVHYYVFSFLQKS